MRGLHGPAWRPEFLLCIGVAFVLLWVPVMLFRHARWWIAVAEIVVEVLFVFAVLLTVEGKRAMQQGREKK